METVEYKDPKDLRAIPIERLNFEGNRLAHQFKEWNDLFSIESAIRVNNDKNLTSLAEIHKWSILSNRYLLMEREHLTDYKLFNKEEVLIMIRDAYYEGYEDCKYNKAETKHELVDTYLNNKQKNI